MKRKDYMLILLVIGIAAVFSYFISGILITTPDDRSQTVEIAEPIASELTRPPADYFNRDAVNPTQKIEIGEDLNQEPFDAE